MESFFNAIVDFLLAVCHRTGLSYPEVNILIYCGLIPGSWALLLMARRRRFWWLLLLHFAAMFSYWQARHCCEGFSRRFYDANIAALEYWAGVTGMGYIGVSLLAGVFFPVLIYGSLMAVPKRWLTAVYAALLLGNLAYYGWVLMHF